MYTPYTTILGQRVASYTLLLLIAVLIALLWWLYHVPKHQRAAAFDTFIAAVIGAILLGRLLHVLHTWAYFVDNPAQITRIDQQGGLNWHGAFIGALIAALLMARWRKFLLNLDTAAPLFALLAGFGWWACGTVACAHGAVVEKMADYPAGLTWFQPDLFGISEPRFATQQLGIALALSLLVLALLLHWREWFAGRRLWLIVLFYCIGDFAISFLRGDYGVHIYNMRVEQWLDVGVMLFAAINMLRIRGAVVGVRHVAPVVEREAGSS